MRFGMGRVNAAAPMEENMGNNVTFLGDVADDFDEQVKQSQAELDSWVERSGYSTGSMMAASTVIAFIRLGQTFVDTLRLGNGVASGTLTGVAVDGLRLLNVTGVGGALFQRISRILVVAQRGGNLCSWISAVNAVRRSGQRFFVSLADLAKAAGVDLRIIDVTGTCVADFIKMEQGLGKLGVPFIALRNTSALGEIAAILKNYPKSVLVFAVRYGTKVNGQEVEAGHQLLATYSKSAGLLIKDTTGAVYRSIEELAKAYTGARLFREYSFVIPNAAAMNVAGDLQNAGALASVILELIPLEVKVPAIEKFRTHMMSLPSRR